MSRPADRPITVPGVPGRGRFFRVRHRYQTFMSAVGTMTIGRRSDCEIVLRDKLVSRVHARIIVGAETAAVEDLSSANGVLVNGQRIRGLQRIQPRDEIKIGEQVLEVLGFAEEMPREEDATEMRIMANTRYDEEAHVTTRVTEPPDTKR